MCWKTDSMTDLLLKFTICFSRLLTSSGDFVPLDANQTSDSTSDANPAATAVAAELPSAVSLPSFLIYFGTLTTKSRAGTRNSVLSNSVCSRWFPIMVQLLMLNVSANPAGNDFLATGPLSPVAQKIRLLTLAFFILASRSVFSWSSIVSGPVQLIHMMSTLWSVAHSSAYRRGSTQDSHKRGTQSLTLLRE